jgi:DNA-directed RNA polymerase specialized sigma24 family protein
VGDPVPEPTHFAAQCGVIARLLADHELDGLDPEEEEETLAAAMSYVIEQLPLLLSRRIKVEDRDPQDIAQEALARFVRAAGAGRVHADHSPAGYLLTIAMNVVRDDIRAAFPTEVLSEALPPPETDVDHVSRLLDRLASADAVRRGLARAYENGDRMTLDVVRAWLDLAHRLGEAPPSRAVAEEVGVSKSTVANVLDRFKGYLAEEHGNDS